MIHTKERIAYLVLVAILGASTVMSVWYAIHERYSRMEWVSQRSEANSEVHAMTRKGVVVDEVKNCTVLSAFEDEQRGLVFRGVPGPAVTPLDANYPKHVIHVVNSGCAGRIVPGQPIGSGEALCLVMLAIREKLATPSMPVDVVLNPGPGMDWDVGKIAMPTGTLTVWVINAGNGKAGYWVYYSFSMLSGPYRDLETSMWNEVEIVVEEIGSVKEKTSHGLAEEH